MRHIRLCGFVAVFIFTSCLSPGQIKATPSLSAPQVLESLAPPGNGQSGQVPHDKSPVVNEQSDIGLSFNPQTYRMDSTGLELLYPQGWMAEESIFGSRASGASLTSWQHPAGELSEIPIDGTILSATLYAWDPKGDLDAYVETRMKEAWKASGIEMISEEEWTLATGQRAVVMRVRNPADEDEALFMVTLAGEDYLVMSGSGDLVLIGEIMKTARFAP